ncbi:hypothetical protein [Ligilactobacillus equi]|uniref:Sporulation initiation inhibitor protein Soj n=2 Tax=Ligilactobacillus equi TaxID=137357 RepID=V7HZ61_9LACO|nr:hypothetical protein [Ligilactobacillus equi]ETA74580.1 sporulation initiation inhibitor protein Soj [Ligilactobacillus equi DPC 6820]KRL84361.1 hypothetical protein FC36_GL000284 [Ligilactobacillus equi DSM 15833 = JCM 10991]
MLTTTFKDLSEQIRFEYCDDLDDFLVAKNPVLRHQETDNYHLLTLTGIELLNAFGNTPETRKELTQLIRKSSNDKKSGFMPYGVYVCTIDNDNKIYYLDYISTNAIACSVPHRVNDEFSADIASLLTYWLDYINLERLHPLFQKFFKEHLNMGFEHIELKIVKDQLKIDVFTTLKQKVNKKAYRKILPKVFGTGNYKLEELASTYQKLTLYVDF